MRLDVDAARGAMAPIARRMGAGEEDAAHAIFEIINEGMADALNERCTKRGFDPREFLLVAGGGAGGLHVAAIARKAGIRRVMIPKFASAYCAFGMQLPDFSQDYVRTYTRRLHDADPASIDTLFAEMEREGRLVLTRSGASDEQIRFVRTADLRYVGQFNEVEVDCPAGATSAESLAQLADAFHIAHEQTFAFSIRNRAVELVYLRVPAIAPTPPISLREIEYDDASPLRARKGARPCYFGRAIGWQQTPVYHGDILRAGAAIDGPALLEEAGSTILVPVGARAEVDRYGNYLIHT
jgi:N-methylhydantoinase A